MRIIKIELGEKPNIGATKKPVCCAKVNEKDEIAQIHLKFIRRIVNCN